MDDTISRAAALSALNGLTDIFLNNLPPTIYKADAVEAVKALPSATDTNVGGNLIDRGAALDALDKVAEMFPWRVPGNRDTYDRYNEAWNDAIGRAEMEIENMPSAQPGWIPTSERLPDNDRAVLVTLKWAEDDYEVAVGEYWHNSTASHGWGSFEGHVIAWHELPTPYREGGQDG